MPLDTALPAVAVPSDAFEFFLIDRWRVVFGFAVSHSTKLPDMEGWVVPVDLITALCAPEVRRRR